MSDFSAAQGMHDGMTADGVSYQPFSKEELRELLGIGRIEKARAPRIVTEFARAGLLMHPAPTKEHEYVRVFRLDTDLGSFANELLTAQAVEEDDTSFSQAARRLEGATPAEVYRKIRQTFADEGWVKFPKPKRSS